MPVEPHIFSENIIDEISFHLYKYPRSAVKELISNGLDQQIGKKNPRIDIFTHVVPDDDLIVEDQGTGIEDLEKFKHIGMGSKRVGDTMSSEKSDIIGHKGFGKFGSRALSGATPEPLVEYLSNRPTTYHPDGTLRYRAQGLEISLLKKGFDIEYVNNTDALDHQGVKVVIKNCRYDKLPSESRLIKYISQWFAIRISRGTEIYFNGNKISKPDGFNSKSEELFTLSDGTVVRGNIKADDHPENDNIWINIKNVYVDYVSVPNRCSGWINDDLLVPTTSREGIEETKRWQEIQKELINYVDQHYPKPEDQKIGKMGKEKEKKQLLIKALQHRHDILLSGPYDASGIHGEISGGTGPKPKWTKKSEITLTPTGGDPDAAPVIPVGDGTRTGGGRYGGKGEFPGYKEGGDHDVITRETDNPRSVEGPINPVITDAVGKAGLDRPMAVLDLNIAKFMWNTSWPQTIKAHNAKGPDWKYLVAPIYAQALTNLDSQEKEQEMDLPIWQDRYCRYMKFFIEAK